MAVDAAWRVEPSIGRSSTEVFRRRYHVLRNEHVRRSAVERQERASMLFRTTPTGRLHTYTQVHWLERLHDVRHALLVVASHLPNKAVQRQASDVALLGRTIGIALYVLPIYADGLTQGLMWRALDEKGGLQYTFLETVNAILPMYWLRVGGGLLYITGALMFAYNYVMTWMSRPATYEEPVYQVLLFRSSTPIQSKRRASLPVCWSSARSSTSGRV